MIEIPIKLLNSKLQNLTTEEIINILNSLPVIKPQQNQVIRGKTTEIAIENIIEDFEIKKSSTHSGDFVINKRNYPSIKIMIEIKNYSNTIPNTEYVKFVDDINNNNYHGGIIIANQNISGLKAGIIDYNKIFIDSYDPQLINIMCEMLWAKIFDMQKYKFIDVEGDIILQCGVLNTIVDNMINIKNSCELIKKNNEKLITKCAKDIDTCIIDTRKIINKIINKLSTEKITTKTLNIELPSGDYFHNTVSAVGEKILGMLKFLHIKICPLDDIIISQNKNIYEYNYTGTKIMVEYLKTKTTIKFKPIIQTFINMNVNFVDGLIEININRANYSIFDIEKILFEYLGF